MRSRIAYHVGNEHNPGNPFGRSALVIEVDGHARHELYTRGPRFAWSFVVLPGTLDRLWAALEEAGFPDFPMIPPAAGSTMRSLRVGEGPDAPSVFLPFHASVRGYDTAFSIMDGILRETSDGKTGGGPVTTLSYVAELAAAEPPPPPERPVPRPVDPPHLGPGNVFLLALLPARRIAHERKLAHLETNTEPELAHARTFGGAALKIAGGLVDAPFQHLDLTAAAMAGGDDVSSKLASDEAKAAWKAGETARDLVIAAEMAAHVAYFRGSAPQNARLRAEAETHARALRERAAQLTIDLGAIGSALATRYESSAAEMVNATGESFAELGALASDLATFFAAMGYHLDDPKPRLFSVIDPVAVERHRLPLWDELAPKIFAAPRPSLRPILERALGLVRADAERVVAGSLARIPGSASSIVDRMNRRTAIANDVRARTMAAEDAYERLAPKSWIGDGRRWFVTDKVPKGTKLDEPTLTAPWTSWVVRREPSSIDVLTTICADPENALLAENYAFEACRHMAVWGWRTPSRVIWLAEERPRFFVYEGARPFRGRADEMARKTYGAFQPPQERGPARDPFEETKYLAKTDVLRAHDWPASAGKNPFEPILEIWRLGYALSAVLDVGIVLLANAPRLDELLDPLAD